jgi:hypothetical protein
MAPLIGHEVFRAIDAVFGRQRFHGGFFGPAAPGVVGLHNILLGAGDNEVDDHRGATNRPDCGAC